MNVERAKQFLNDSLIKTNKSDLKSDTVIDNWALIYDNFDIHVIKFFSTKEDAVNYFKQTFINSSVDGMSLYEASVHIRSGTTGEVYPNERSVYCHHDHSKGDYRYDDNLYYKSFDVMCSKLMNEECISICSCYISADIILTDQFCEYEGKFYTSCLKNEKNIIIYYYRDFKL